MSITVTVTGVWKGEQHLGTITVVTDEDGNVRGVVGTPESPEHLDAVKGTIENQYGASFDLTVTGEGAIEAIPKVVTA